MNSDAAQSFKQKDASSYDHVTSEFDCFSDRLSSPLARHLVTMAHLRPGARALDIGTGTGIVALQAARVVETNGVTTSGSVVGIDLSQKMISMAHDKARRAGFDERIEFRVMDAEDLDFPVASFDAVLSLFALLHFPDAPRALREMFRVLRPGGALVLAVGSGAPLFSGRGFAHRLRRVFQIPRSLCGRQLNAPDFLNSLVDKHLPPSSETPESTLASNSLNRTRSVPELVREAGFQEMRCDWRGHFARFGAAEEFWDLQRTYSSIARKRLADASPAQAEAVREEFLRTARQVLARGGHLLYPYAAFYVSARRPSQ